MSKIRLILLLVSIIIILLVLFFKCLDELEFYDDKAVFTSFSVSKTVSENLI